MKKATTIRNYGVVSGLDVKTSEEDNIVLVNPGTAIDPYGNKIVLDCPYSLLLPSNLTKSLYVTLRLIKKDPRTIPTLKRNVRNESCTIILCKLKFKDDKWIIDNSCMTQADQRGKGSK